MEALPRVSINLWLSVIIILGFGLFISSPSYAAKNNHGADNFAKMMRSSYANTFVFEPRRLRWKAINNNGKVVRSGRASGGANYCPDVKRRCRTPVGSYRIISKRGASCRSSKYPLGRGGAPMPYCMFFTKLYGIHGSYDVPRRNASHGCIRVPKSDARWLYYNFIRMGTRVVVRPY